jgi:uncharacterized DUF497 family protein
MKFDDTFDKNKSEKTKLERGLDFIEARAIWLDSECVSLPAKNVEGESRTFTVGQIEGKLWVAIWTYRFGDQIRIISVRRAEGTTPFVFLLSFVTKTSFGKPSSLVIGAKTVAKVGSKTT